MCRNSSNKLKEKMMRLFKRRESDPNPQLESVSTLSENNDSVEHSRIVPRVPSNESIEIQKPYLSTWGKAWEKIKRQDSSEFLLHKTKKRSFKIEESCSGELSQANLSEPKQNSFESSEKPKITDDDVKKVYEMYKNVNNGTTMKSAPLRNTVRSRRNMKCVSDNIELNQQQLLDYLMLIKPNSEDLDKIFDVEKSEDDGCNYRLEEKKKRRSKLRSMFTKRSSSKSDDESDVSFKRINQKSSSTDSLSSILNYIMPKRRQTSKSPTSRTKFKSDESGYGSDSTKTTTLDSPVSSIKSQTSQTSHEIDTDGEMDRTLVNKELESYRGRQEISDDTDTADEDEDVEIETTYAFSKFYSRSPTKSTAKKRTRSQSSEAMTKEDSKRRSVKLKSSPSKIDTNITQCCEGIQNLKIIDPSKTCNLGDKHPEEHNSILEKEFKCVKLRVKPNEMVGIKLSATYGNSQILTYVISEMSINSVASRNQNLRVGDEVIKVNGIRIKGLPQKIVKNHFGPKNNELELVISRTVSAHKFPSKVSKKRTNSFKAFLSKPAALLTPKKDFCNKTSNSSIPKSPSQTSMAASKFLGTQSKKSNFNGVNSSPIIKSASKSSIGSQKSSSILKSSSKSSVVSFNNISNKSIKSPVKSNTNYHHGTASKSPEEYVGLSDILKNQKVLESRVTFSGQVPSSENVICGKPPLYLKGEEKGVFKSPSPAKKFSPSARKPENVRNNMLEKEFKCVKLMVKNDEIVGIKLKQKVLPQEPKIWIYIISEIATDSAAGRNGNLKIGDEIIEVNGIRLKGLSQEIAEYHFIPINNKLELVVTRTRVPCSPRQIRNTFLHPATSVSRSPSPRLGLNRASPKESPNSSPTLHGMRKFSLSSSTRPQLSKCIPVPNKVEKVKSSKICDKTVTFIKGPGKKSLGFSIVGGRDSPKGPLGVYVKTIFKDGQASDSKVLQEGDELLTINGTSFQGLSHSEAVALFKTIKCGEVVIEVASRHPFRMYSHSM